MARAGDSPVQAALNGRSMETMIEPAGPIDHVQHLFRRERAQNDYALEPR